MASATTRCWDLEPAGGDPRKEGEKGNGVSMEVLEAMVDGHGQGEGGGYGRGESGTGACGENARALMEIAHR